MSTPPTPDALLEMMRDMLTEDPQQNAVIFFGADGQDAIMPCLDHHPKQMLALLEAGARDGKIPRPDWIAIVTDSYAIAGREEEMPSPMRPGLLGELFEAGDPRVREAILATCIAPDGPTYASQQKYTKTERGIEWDEPEDFPVQDATGTIANGMRRVLGMEVNA